MPTIQELARKIDTRSVIIRGHNWPVRKLSIAQQDAVRRSIPLPVPPVGFDRTKGTAAGPVLDYESPAYRAEVASRERRISLVEACVALGISFGSDGSPITVPDSLSSDTAWRAYAAAAWQAVAVEGLLYDDDINAVHKALEDVTPDRMMQAAEGN